MKFLGPPSSGSIAGTTSSHNRAGQYTRNRRSPVQPVGTGRRAFIRGAFGASSQSWATLSAATQAAWNAYAASHALRGFTRSEHHAHRPSDVCRDRDELAERRQCFAGCCACFELRRLRRSIAVFTATAAGVITITLTPSGTASDFILIAFSAPQSPGRTFCKTFWQQTHVPGNSVGGATYGTAYVAQFGTIPAGWKIFLKLHAGESIWSRGCAGDGHRGGHLDASALLLIMTSVLLHWYGHQVVVPYLNRAPEIWTCRSAACWVILTLIRLVGPQSVLLAALSMGQLVLGHSRWPWVLVLELRYYTLSGRGFSSLVGCHHLSLVRCNETLDVKESLHRSLKSRRAKAARRELTLLLGGRCSRCGCTESLEFDCIVPVGSAHHFMPWPQRIRFYWQQHLNGNLQLLCSVCHRQQDATRQLQS